MSSRTSTKTVLILAANPRDSDRLRLDKEVREIQNGLRAARRPFEVKQQWAVRPIDVRRALLDFKPEFVHFCGHGSGTNGIALEDDHGNTHLVGADALAGLFALFADQIRCVVLNACYSSVQAKAIGRHIPNVVGMDRKIGDDAAIEFAVAFYDGVGAGKSVSFAYQLGCNAIALAGIPESLTPTLITPSGLLEPDVTALPDGEAEPRQRYDWGDAPDVPILLGRETELKTLEHWIINDRCRIVLISGLGGVGKTGLAVRLGQGGVGKTDLSVHLAQGIQTHFEFVFWRTLLNAPPLDELLSDLTGVLSHYRDLTLRVSSHQRIAELLACLKKRRCLIILDNVEAILRPGSRASRYRDGYDGYGELFRQVGTVPHQSCLILTSREKPHELIEMEGERRPVRTFALRGLSTKDGRKLFEQIGHFQGRDEDWKKVVELYNGNPLALELAARHIDEVFSGDLSAFLSEGQTLFSDLRGLLDWHLNRLSPQELEVMYWLAIDREPVSLRDLQGDLLSPIAKEQLTSTLQVLQRRLPLEKAASQFTLQPVLIEYMTSRLVEQAGGEFTISRPETLEHVTQILVEHAGKEIAGGEINLVNQYALLKAMAKEHVRESQRRLILQPIAERLLATFGSLNTLSAHLMTLLDVVREDQTEKAGYAAGNVVNLLCHMGADMRHKDLSRLTIWQAFLQGAELQQVRFAYSAFRGTLFTQTFGNTLCVTFSPQGDLLAAGDDSNKITVWRLIDGQMAFSCTGHESFVNTVAFSPKGDILASGAIDHAVRLWNAADGHCEAVLLGHTDWVNTVAFSPDGETLVSGSEDGTVRAWNIRSKECVGILAQQTSWIGSLAISPDGKYLAFGGADKVVTILQLDDTNCQATLVGHSGRVRSVAFSPDGAMLASGSEDGAVIVWSTATGNSILTLRAHSDWIRAVSYSPRGDLLASGGDDRIVRLWDPVNGTCLSSLRCFENRVWSIAFSPSGHALATGSDDQTIRIWEVQDYRCLAVFRGYAAKIWSIAFAREQGVLVSGSEDGIVRVWKVHNESCSPCGSMRGHTSRIWAVACSPNGRWVASASDDLSVRVWDLEKQTCAANLRGHKDWVRCVGFHPASSCLASGGEDHEVRIWDFERERCVATLKGHVNRVLAVAFSPLEECLASAGEDRLIKIWEVGGLFLYELRGHTDKVRAVSFSTVEKTLASCSEDGRIMLWDLERRQCVRTFEVGGKVWSLAFSPNGAMIASGSEDGVLRLWDVRSGRCDLALREHESRIWSVAWSSDGDEVASGGDDGTIRIVNVEQRIVTRLLRPPRPYEEMDITGSTGLTEAQRLTLQSLGAIDRG